MRHRRQPVGHFSRIRIPFRQLYGSNPMGKNRRHFYAYVSAGAVIIETVFEIPGMGRLSLEAIVGRDYPIFMGILSLTAILGLVGNILSDFMYVLIDPMINFHQN